MRPPRIKIFTAWFFTECLPTFAIYYKHGWNSIMCIIVLSLNFLLSVNISFYNPSIVICLNINYCESIIHVILKYSEYKDIYNPSLPIMNSTL